MKTPAASRCRRLFVHKALVRIDQHTNILRMMCIPYKITTWMRGALVILGAASLSIQTAAAAQTGLTLPDGFSITVFAKAPGARSLALAEDLGAVIISTRQDTVYAVPLRDDDGLRPTYPVLRVLT